jgi:hypothetical protein
MRSIYDTAHNAFRQVLSSTQLGYSFFLARDSIQKWDNLGRIIYWRIHLTGTVSAMAHTDSSQCSCDQDFLEQVPKGLIAQLSNCLNFLICCIAANEVCMGLSSVLPMSRSAIASSGQPVPWSDHNRNNITHISSIGNIKLAIERIIVEGAMSLGF